MRPVRLPRDAARRLVRAGRLAPGAVPPAPSKYGNLPVVVGGVRFDSRKEARVVAELQMLEARGEIVNLRFRKSECRYPLVVAGELVATYTPDATFVRASTGEVVWLDVKSPASRRKEAYRLRRRLVKAIYGIEITEV